MTLALPLRLWGDEILDADGVSIALLRGEMEEYRNRGAEIVAAVNSHADLLAAAKEAIALIGGGRWTQEKMKLQAAIVKAEQT